MVERTVTISVLLLHLVVLAIGAYLATKGQITIGTFVTFESAFWEVSYNIAHLMHFIPVSIQAAAAVRHIQELLDEPTRGADRPGGVPTSRSQSGLDRDPWQSRWPGRAPHRRRCPPAARKGIAPPLRPPGRLVRRKSIPGRRSSSTPPTPGVRQRGTFHSGNPQRSVFSPALLDQAGPVLVTSAPHRPPRIPLR